MSSEILVPKIIVLPSAWEPIKTELDRAYHKGMENRGQPDETVFMPLCGFTARKGRSMAPKIEKTSISDIEFIVIADSAILPCEMLESNPMHVSFRRISDGWDETQEKFDDILDRAFLQNCRLELIARGHSHPFAHDRTFPSHTDKTQHLLPCLKYNETLGIEAGFTFIAIRDKSDEGWKLQGFATQNQNKIIDLGSAIFPQESSEFSAFRSPAFFDTTLGKEHEKKFQEIFANNLKIDRLPFGWSRYRIFKPESNPSSRVLALPPDFPGEPGRCFREIDGAWVGRDVHDWSEFLPI